MMYEVPEDLLADHLAAYENRARFDSTRHLLGHGTGSASNRHCSGNASLGSLSCILDF